MLHSGQRVSLASGTKTGEIQRRTRETRDKSLRPSSSEPTSASLDLLLPPTLPRPNSPPLSLLPSPLATRSPPKGHRGRPSSRPLLPAPRLVSCWRSRPKMSMIGSPPTIQPPPFPVQFFDDHHSALPALHRAQPSQWPTDDARPTSLPAVDWVLKTDREAYLATLGTSSFHFRKLGRGTTQ